uniref:VWFC domain-containing protein n=1 Tax=Hucho hucho TaxID=62062 RepID=A0A4W5RTZ4_9TELE
MFEQAVWSPKPCVTCLCSGGEVLCDEVTCPPLRCHFPYTPTGECCPVCMDTGPASHGDVLDFSGDSPVANDPDPVTPDLDPILDPVVPRTKAEIELLNREEEERLLKKEKRRKKQKEEAERQRRRQEERRRRQEEERRQEERRREEEGLRIEKEERRQEEAMRLKEEVAMKERERKLEEERRRHEDELKEKLRELAELEEEEEEEEDMEWLLRGDVFQMFPDEPSKEDLLPPPLAEPTDREEEDGKGVVVRRPGIALPLGCDISDVTVTCENAQLTNFPPLNIPELKSLSLEGNSITTIPVGAFNGIPNLESINLGKNKLTTAGIAPHTFKGLKFLSRLYLDNNLLEKVPPDFPSTLQELKINENHLKGIEENSFQGNTKK